MRERGARKTAAERVVPGGWSLLLLVLRRVHDAVSLRGEGEGCLVWMSVVMVSQQTNIEEDIGRLR